MRASLRRSALFAALCVCAGVLLSARGVDAGVTLRMIRPRNATSSFSYQGSQGRIYAEPSLFGLPNYQAEVIGRLQMDDPANNNAQGCNTYAPDSFVNHTDPNPRNPYLVALVLRGGCRFGQKALMAQAAGASAIIVYTTQVGVQYPLPVMAGGADTPNINIPGMLINYRDGAALLADVTAWTQARAAGTVTSPFYDGVWVSLAYSIVAPDDRVEWDLYTYPDEAFAANFLQVMAPVVETLGSKALFTPHYKIMDGSLHGCTPDVSEPCDDDHLSCGTQCTNCGKYCYVDPNGDLNSKPDGEDVVREAAYQKCLWQWGQNNGAPLLWWHYILARQALVCGTNPNPIACQASAASQVPVPPDAAAFISTCMGTLDYLALGPNDLLESELNWAAEWQPLQSPYMFVNNFTYPGSFSCADPANVATCGPLSIICKGYAEGTAPALCTGNGCPSGVERDACGVCGGSATTPTNCGNGCAAGVDRDACGVCGGGAAPGSDCAGPSAKFPTGLVIGIILLVCALLSGGVYLYMRRQNNRMRDDIDSLLKQYLPLDGQAGLNGSSAAKSGTRSPTAQQNPNQNLRLIGNLDSADEPTDL